MAIIIMVLSLMPIGHDAGSGLFDFPHFDKIAHFILYSLLSFLLLYELNRMKISIYIFVLLPIIICLFYGGIIEIIQIFIEGRGGDIFDLLADLLGAIVAFPIFFISKKLFPNIFS